MERVQVKGEEQKGQENAMEIAATQNTRLLKVATAKTVRAATATERGEHLADYNVLRSPSVDRLPHAEPDSQQCTISCEQEKCTPRADLVVLYMY